MSVALPISVVTAMPVSLRIVRSRAPPPSARLSMPPVGSKERPFPAWEMSRNVPPAVERRPAPAAPRSIVPPATVSADPTRYRPGGRYTGRFSLASEKSMAAWMKVVSLLAPSPTAPNQRTLIGPSSWSRRCQRPTPPASGARTVPPLSPEASAPSHTNRPPPWSPAA